MNRSSSWIAVLPSLVIPLCAGLTMYLGMAAMLEKDLITNETAIRYIAGHPVSGFTLGMFFVGVSSLVMISCNLFAQYRWSNRISLDKAAEHIRNLRSGDSQSPTGSDDGITEEVADVQPENEDALSSDPDSAGRFARALLIFPAPVRDHYLWRRLHDALHFIHRTGSSAGIEDELKYLGDMDGERQQQRYSLVRILIWATPMLGFLGTVLGISQALGGINVGPDNDFQQMMGSLRGSLYVAFDTTALALVLSMVLMFGQFFVDRFESQLLSLVDHRSRRELSNHFVMSATGDEVTDSVQRIGRTLLTSSNEMVRHQTAIWTKSIAAAEKAWVETLAGASDQVSQNLTSALDQSVESLASYLGQTIERADDSMAGRLEQWQVSLSENARKMREHQDELIRHTELISGLVDKMGTVTEFQSALEVNSDTLEAHQKLQQTLAELIEVVSAANETRSLAAEQNETQHTETAESADSTGIVDVEERDEVLTVEPDNEPPVQHGDRRPDGGSISSDQVDSADEPPSTLPIRPGISRFVAMSDSPARDADSIDVTSEALTDATTETSEDMQIVDEFSPTIPFPAAASSIEAESSRETGKKSCARYLQAEVESGETPSLTFPVQIPETRPVQRTKKAA